MTVKREIKRIRKDEVREPNPLYNAFCYQMSAAVELARKIEANKEYPLPSYVERFLNEFGRKAA